MKWLTSKNKKRHQREMNKMVRKANKAIEEDSLWCGRFVIRQVNSPQWNVYYDKSGAEYFVHLEITDRCTGRKWIGADTVNRWRGPSGSCYHLYEFINWFIVNYCNIWEEPFAKARDFNAWREYNRTCRKV